MLKNDQAWSLEECQEILNLPTHIIAKISSEGNILKLNEELVHILGWEPSLALGKKLEEFVHPDDISIVRKEMGSLFRKEKDLITDFIFRCRRVDNTYRYISWTASVRSGFAYALGTDVTEKIEFEDELTIQSLILESISEGVLISNRDGEVVYINSAEEKLFGYEKNELLGKSMFLLNAIPEDEISAYLSDVFQQVKSEGIWQGEWLNVKKDGTKFITSCHVTALWLHGEKHFVVVQRDITKEKREVREKFELQNRFKTFFEQSSLPMQIYDLEGNALQVNQAWCEMFDLSPEAIIGYNLLKDPSSEVYGTLPYIQRAIAGEAQDVPAFYVDPTVHQRGGRGRWVEAYFSPIRNEHGKIKELAVFLRDVTSRVEAENKLQESISERKVVEDRLGMAVKVGKIGIWEWVPGSDKVYWDETLQSIYGYEPGTWTGSLDDYRRGIYPEDAPNTWKVIADSQKARKPYVVEHRIIRRDGEVRWTQGSGTTIFDERGKPILMTGTCVDITDKKIAVLDQQFMGEVSEILSQSFDFKTNLQKMADAAVEYFCDACVVDQLKADGSIERIIVGMKDPVLREKEMKLQEKYPERYSHDHPLFNALVTGRTIFVEDCRVMWPMFREKFGEGYFLDLAHIDSRSVISVRLKGRESLLGTITFFTVGGSKFTFRERHKRLVEEIAYRTSMAMENSILYQNSQEAIRSRDEFLSIASHELKTPLQSLMLQNQMRKREMDKGIQVLNEIKLKKMLDTDDRQLQRISRLIDDMLDIARIRAKRLTIHKEKFDFVPFLADVVDRLAPQMNEAGCKYSLQLCEAVSLQADAYRIEQVIVNLLTNAMKFGAGKPIRLEVVKFSYKIRLMVHDQGPGIHLDDSERIFQRFERATNDREISGLGLGLYISRQIVQDHEGALYVTSNPGSGSTFIMELPL